MYYVSDGKVYIKDGSTYRNVGITAKDKVITHHELESVTVVPGEIVVSALTEPVALTLDELIKKFNISEENPVPIIEADKALADMTLAELKAYAKRQEIDLGEATKKADILAILEAAEGVVEGDGEPDPEAEAESDGEPNPESENS